MHAAGFENELERHGLRPLVRRSASTLQVNLTRRCNLACLHCHVESSPRRTESMDASTVTRVLELLEASPQVELLDLTGGAPELHDGFRRLVRGGRSLGRRVIDRCNLTVLYEPGQADTAAFLADQGVEVVASLPCYSKKNVEAQRGRHVFDRSIQALRMLNGLGYAQPGSPLVLDLVYNPLGASLPPAQKELEETFRRELRELFGIEFHRLLVLTNMPITRFAEALRRRGEYEAYAALLVENFNPQTVPSVMCRSLISVSYDGTLHDCDFNQVLELPLGASSPGVARTTVWDVDDLATFTGARITTGSHCFACTAGSGSGCSGVLV